MKVHVLVENQGSDQCCGEHGLSLLIEHKGLKYLLDAGQTSLFLDNAKHMHCDLEDVDEIILSHGHYDHADGFLSYLNEYPDKKIWASESIFKPYYSNSHNQWHYIGLDSRFYRYRDHFLLINKNQEVKNASLILDPISIDTKIAKQRQLYIKKGEQLVLDDFSHELSLVFETPKGLVIFNSCSHAGLQAICKHCIDIFNRPIYAYIGGLHLKSTNTSDQQIKEIADYILSSIEVVYTGHCTGESAFQKLKKYCPDIIKPLVTGKSFIL